MSITDACAAQLGAPVDFLVRHRLPSSEKIELPRKPAASTLDRSVCTNACQFSEPPAAAALGLPLAAFGAGPALPSVLAAIADRLPRALSVCGQAGSDEEGTGSAETAADGCEGGAGGR